MAGLQRTKGPAERKLRISLRQHLELSLRLLLNTSKRLVWAAGEVVQEQVQISAAKLQPGSYAVWMGMYAPVTQMRASVEAGPALWLIAARYW